MTKYILLLFTLLLLASCATENTSVLDTSYQQYLNADHQETAIASMDKEINFWQKKLEVSPENSVYLQKLAGLLSARFGLEKDIEDLTASDQILKGLQEIYPSNVGILHALVANSVTQHKFNDALDYAARAYDIGENKQASQLMMVDVFLEKGDLEQAIILLEELDAKNRFDVQIRYVKLYDAQGNLDKAVETMESALANAQETNKKGLTTWALSNLADMYGHQGKVQKSYDYYLKTLALDPAHTHSLKGIGWIAYSHEQDYNEAIRIWNLLYEIQPDPELEILLSAAFSMKGDELLANALRERFIADVSDARYGNMYGSYLVDPLSMESPERGLAIAQRDLDERKHPVTYGHYALALHRAGRTEEAVKILKENVMSKTEEPDAYYMAGVILAEYGDSDAARKMLSEALAASYELGPSTTQEVKRRLKTL